MEEQSEVSEVGYDVDENGRERVTTGFVWRHGSRGRRGELGGNWGGIGGVQQAGGLHCKRGHLSAADCGLCAPTRLNNSRHSSIIIPVHQSLLHLSVSNAHRVAPTH